MGSGKTAAGHLLRCHVLNVKTLPTTNLTDAIYNLIGETVDLSVAPLDSLAAVTLSIQGAHTVISIGDEDAVEGVGHRVSPLDYLSSIGHPGGSRRGSVPPSQLVWKRPLLKLARLNASRFTILKVPNLLA